MGEVDAGLPNAARLGAGEFDQRCMVANERIAGIHHHGISRADRIPPARTDVAAAARTETTEPALADVGVFGGFGLDRIIKFPVIEHLAPKTAVNEAASVLDKLPVKIGRNGRPRLRGSNGSNDRLTWNWRLRRGDQRGQKKENGPCFLHN